MILGFILIISKSDRDSGAKNAISCLQRKRMNTPREGSRIMAREKPEFSSLAGNLPFVKDHPWLANHRSVVTQIRGSNIVQLPAPPFSCRQEIESPRQERETGRPPWLVTSDLFPGPGSHLPPTLSRFPPFKRRLFCIFIPLLICESVHTCITSLIYLTSPRLTSPHFTSF